MPPTHLHANVTPTCQQHTGTTTKYQHGNNKKRHTNNIPALPHQPSMLTPPDTSTPPDSAVFYKRHPDLWTHLRESYEDVCCGSLSLMYISLYLYVRLYGCLSVHLSARLYVCLYLCMSICMYVFMSVRLSVCLSLSVCLYISAKSR